MSKIINDIEEIEYIGINNDGIVEYIKTKDGITIDITSCIHNCCKVIDVELMADKKYFDYKATVGCNRFKKEWLTLIDHTITIDGKEIRISEESYQELKKSLL